MASLPRDSNNVVVAGGVYNDGSGTIVPLPIDPATGNLLITAIVGGSAALVVGTTPITGGTVGNVLTIGAGNVLGSAAASGSGTVTSVSVSTANGVSGTVATSTTTPAITLTLGAITPTSVNGLTVSNSTGTLAIANGKTETFSNTLTFTGTDGSSVAFGTGGTVLYANQTVTLTGAVTGSGATSIATTIQSSIALPGSPTTTTQAQNDNSTKVATTAYTDLAVANAVAGVNPAIAVQAATTSAGNTSGLTYSNGVGGVGATLTGSNNTALTIDGFTFTAVGQRLLVKNDTQSPSGAFNGIYYVTQVQTSLLPPILTRALDYDQPSDMNNTGAIPVVSGTVNALTSWLLTSQVATVGTSPLTYAQFSVNPATPAGSTIYTMISTDFSNVARLSITNVNGGTTGPVGASPLNFTSGNSATASTNATYALYTASPQYDLSNSTWTYQYGASGLSGTPTGIAFMGVGLLTVSGTNITMTGAHFGFKIVWAGSTGSLMATQADGTTEAASSSMATVSPSDILELTIVVGTTSASYYVKQNNSARSAATVLSTNMPTLYNSLGELFQVAASNQGNAKSVGGSIQGFSMIKTS